MLNNNDTITIVDRFNTATVNRYQQNVQLVDHCTQTKEMKQTIQSSDGKSEGIKSYRGDKDIWKLARDEHIRMMIAAEDMGHKIKPNKGMGQG